MCTEVFGEAWEEIFVIAHLSTGDRVGVEIFEFIKTQSNPEKNFEYWKQASFHFCVAGSQIPKNWQNVICCCGR